MQTFSKALGSQLALIFSDQRSAFSSTVLRQSLPIDFYPLNKLSFSSYLKLWMLFILFAPTNAKTRSQGICESRFSDLPPWLPSNISGLGRVDSELPSYVLLELTA